MIDEDDGSNSQITYQLLNNTGGVFAVEPGTSRQQVNLRLIHTLDYETLSSYLLTLVATDGGTPSHTSSATIDIRVQDVADNPPQFNASSYSISVPENTSVGSYLLTVLATTLDSHEQANIM